MRFGNYSFNSFNNFSDNIISLYVLPYKPSNLPTKGFKVGGLDSTDLALASVEYITSRFVTLDMLKYFNIVSERKIMSNEFGYNKTIGG
mgnify:CR=1 FL=1